MLVTNIFTFFVFFLYPFPQTPFGDRPKFNEAADDNLNVAITDLKIQIAKKTRSHEELPIPL